MIQMTCSLSFILITFFVSEVLNIETSKKLSTKHLPDTKTDVCSLKTCIKKCCRENSHVVGTRRCVPNKNDSYNVTLQVYNVDLERIGKEFHGIFNLVPGAFKNASFRKKAYEVTVQHYNVYLTESGILYLELPNAFDRWTPKPIEDYCLDYHEVVREDNSTYTTVGVWARFPPDDEDEQSNAYFTAGMIISCVFLLLVMLVYMVLPELRNLGGKVLMAYTGSLFFAFFLLMIVQKGNHSNEECIGLTFLVYFFFLSSFCWMNIMSLDIWWTFRGYAKARPIHRRGEVFKFCMYCLYAWGLPLAMTIALAVLNFADLRHLPWLVTPKIPDKGCFLERGEKLVYLYFPMLVLIVLNWMFFLMTAFNIWRLSRGTSVLDSAAAGNPAAHRTQWHRFLVYLKLSVVMGVNWILEVVSYFKPNLKIWYLSDGYNLLIGLAIFIIFVCKRNILRKLEKTFFPQPSSRNPSCKSRSRSSSVTETSHISTDVPDILMCPNPKGAKYV